MPNLTNFQDKFGVRSLRNSDDEMMAALYLQVSIVSQALIFVTRSRGWSFLERPGLLLVTAFFIAQLVRLWEQWNITLHTWVQFDLTVLWYDVSQVATLIAVYADWGFARIKGCGWGWAGVVWLYSIVFYVPLDLMKFAIRYILSGKAWLNLLENKVNKHPILSSLRHHLNNYYDVFLRSVLHTCMLIRFCLATDCLHHKERLRKRREGSAMGSCSEDSTRASTPRSF